MAIVVPAVAFAAFCVWLTVRIVKRRERWEKWSRAVTLGLPVAYVSVETARQRGDFGRLS